MNSKDITRRKILRAGAGLPLTGLMPVAATVAAAPAAPTTIGNFPPGVGAVTVTPYKIGVPQERLDKVMRRLRVQQRVIFQSSEWLRRNADVSARCRSA